jgi:hypothetical protein
MKTPLEYLAVKINTSIKTNANFIKFVSAGKILISDTYVT